MNIVEKNRKLQRRKLRVRKSVVGTTERPRLSVFRSRAHIYAQIIDDLRGCTLAAASTMDKTLRTSLKSTGSIEGAKAVGKLLAERARVAKVSKVVFDRGGRLYHGRVRALAEASREGGLEF
ncbi:MAG: 50S ribosomal protein L18 [Nitrospirae bacterium]|nr:MAG: 50S ribosomal protein L18 [Nitrospira sp. OLB3]MBV6469623.1 50S ribosomal protein L18 [Nitrospirota bacterium]MCE7965536.1 50S ribosomal protein L18 [Nitrospira sp. NTP2]MEB2338781.1 50S ribosomal protein L18 [Nitrospirales bacterium]QOJ34296.1 MAG: 50S ribosomal protein L18 [Nitrospira sp.]